MKKIISTNLIEGNLIDVCSQLESHDKDFLCQVINELRTSSKDFFVTRATLPFINARDVIDTFEKNIYIKYQFASDVNIYNSFRVIDKIVNIKHYERIGKYLFHIVVGINDLGLVFSNIQIDRVRNYQLVDLGKVPIIKIQPTYNIPTESLPTCKLTSFICVVARLCFEISHNRCIVQMCVDLEHGKDYEQIINKKLKIRYYHQE